MKFPWSSDDKTKVVGSLRKQGPKEGAGEGGIRESSGDEKTVVIRSQNVPIDERIGKIDQAHPTDTEKVDSRLSWPARDAALSNRRDYRNASGRSALIEEQTKIYKPAATPSEESQAGGNAAREEESPKKASDDPVVGWLVIVEGPGVGRSFELGMGSNSIGRDRTQKVQLVFGDEHISREKHASVVYDAKSMRFFLQGGDVRNLTYLGDEAVLNPTQLKGREIISIGNTKLMFVPFCGPEFGWK